MTGKQWAGVAVAVVMILILFWLPQTVVKSGSDTLATSSPPPATAAPAAVEEHSDDDGHDHSADDGHKHGEHQFRQELTEAARLHLQNLKESASNTADKEKFAIFADSLAANWAKWAWYDSAAYWSEQALKAKPTTNRRYRAGSMWFESYQLAPDVAQQRQFAERAASHLKEVLEAQPTRSDAQVRLALTYVVTDNPMQGIVLLRQVLEREPNNVEALYHMGILSFQSNQHDKAVERFEQLVKLQPQHKEGHFYLAMSYLELGKKDKAREHLLAVKELESNAEVRAVVDGYLERL
ncbi:tetratricopeptide repeat protein [Cesiribacter andamanensis]|uniref:Putative O-linked N-acetylglucosamine transferase, SPINDLY family n=1 Tax=Cesiribacter andamanensis AMV16 TaxID=1279009 RepID=M7N0G8_9BACT|nr:tetratricopeptide repeat protein [Cesiribacter andamanensis]EMR00772.1 putative O-linked N-acetylglucosamine transferase, SPINDLY family [Cesiribacter andamanensis AMV16]